VLLRWRALLPKVLLLPVNPVWKVLLLPVNPVWKVLLAKRVRLTLLR
jgi:hypothetical protein